jgi:hypothetical protein
VAADTGDSVAQADEIGPEVHEQLAQDQWKDEEADVEEQDVCVPGCAGKECGDDGCGGSCGGCSAPFIECQDGLCACGPTCAADSDCDDGDDCTVDICDPSVPCPACLSFPLDCGEGEICTQGTCGPWWGGKWIQIPGGTFQMGCSPEDSCCDGGEFPVHEVAVAPFEMMETEMTQAQYVALGGTLGVCGFSEGGGPDTPAMCTSWQNAKGICEAAGGRLPTEAEWEYAARGGTTTARTCGDYLTCQTDFGWYDMNSGGHPHPGKELPPNGFGLYDMLGNAWEWVEDCIHKDYEGAPNAAYPAWTVGCDHPEWGVHRGGSYWDMYCEIRVSVRGYCCWPDDSNPIGIRCARSAQ